MALGSSSSIFVRERMDRESIRFTLEWTIDKFTTLRQKSGLLRSAGITMRELGQDAFQGRWRIMVNPCVMRTEEAVEKFYVGAYLGLTDVSVESFSYTSDRPVDAEFAIRVSTGKKADAITSSGKPLKKTFCSKWVGWGAARLIFHDDLFGNDNKPGLLKDDSLTIVIEVMTYGELKAVTAPEIVTANNLSQRYQQFLRRQAEALASNPRLQSTDFTIHSSDGQAFPTYRNLLMSHSPVFAAILSQDSKEKHLSQCELEDIDGETVGVLLDYVHGCDTGKVTAGNAEKVLVMADKYEIVDLPAVCEEILARSVTGENAVHYLVLARQSKLDKLQEASLKVIPKNMGTVLKNGALQEALQFDPELMQVIMEYCSKKMRLNDMS